MKLNSRLDYRIQMESRGIRRLWLDFRNGHGIYLAFIFSFVNFILLAYRFVIEPSTEYTHIFDRLAPFAILFVLIYVPAAIGIGYWHRKTQYKVESDIKFMYNPLFAKAMRILIDIKLGRAGKEDIKQIHDILKKIENKGEEDKDYEPM
ncbi:MAG: hypothetical protein ACRD9Q_03510 [Nitrososphaeraceae archaeon]